MALIAINVKKMSEIYMSIAIRESLILYHHYLYFGFQMHINTSLSSLLVHLKICHVTCAGTDNMITEAKHSV